MYRGWRDYQSKLSGGYGKRFAASVSKRATSVSILILLLTLIATFLANFSDPLAKYSKPVKAPDKTDVASAVYQKVVENFNPKDIDSNRTFSKMTFIDHGKERSYFVKLSIDKSLQKRMERLLKRYKPPYAALVAMDPDTAKIKAMASYSRLDDSSNWCLKSSFRAASIFKVITSAAAIEKIHMGRNSRVGFNGRYYRLSRRSVFDKRKRFRNHMTLGNAFAKSVNIVFAKLIEKGINPDDLRTYSEDFFFNRDIPFELDVEESIANIPDENYQLARTAAGFGDVTLSPLHGAVIVNTILNDGIMSTPYVIDKIYDSRRKLLYRNTSSLSEEVIEPSTAITIKKMMGLTLKQGTIRKSFRGWRRDRTLRNLTIGGKTGSLSSRNLRGQHDWFVGFAEGKEKKLVISAVIVNHALWHIKPMYLAKEAFRNYFKE